MRRRLPAAALALALGLGLVGCSAEETAVSGPAEVRSYSGASSIGTELDAPDGDGELAMPHLAFRVSRSGTLDTLPYDDAVTLHMDDDYDLEDGDELAAPEGSEFVIATLTRVAAPYSEGAAAVPSVQLTIGSRTAAAPVFPNGRDETTLLVVADKDDDVLVQIVDAGQIATMNLRTGERSEDGASADTALYYPLNYGPPSVALTPVSATLGDDAATMQLEAGSVSLQPWNPVQGWAPAGSAWLSFGPTDVEVVTSSDDQLPAMAMLFPWKQITVTPLGGVATNPQPFSIVEPRGISQHAQLAPEGMSVEVPVDARTFTLTFTPETTDSNTGEVIGPWSPGSTTINLSG